MPPSAVDGIIDCVAGAILGEEGGRKARKGKKILPYLLKPPPFFHSSQSPTPFDACYAGYGIVISISLD